MPVRTKEATEREIAWLVSMLRSAQQRDFYGNLTIKMEGGIVKMIEKSEKLLPPPT